MTAGRVHVVVTTHPPRHLSAVFAALASQTRQPDTVVVSADTEDARIGEATDQLARLVTCPVAWVRRSSAEKPRPAQTRNNGVRALEHRWSPHDSDLIVLLDGDMCLEREGLAKHLAFSLSGYDVVVPFRVDLDEARTTRLKEAWASGSQPAVEPNEADRAKLERRHHRYLWQQRLAPLGLVKRHKPKVNGCHHSIRLGVYRAVNGYDEAFDGFASEDDDVSRRMHQLRPEPRFKVAVRDIVALHLWHPSREPAPPNQRPEYHRWLRRDLPIVAEEGLRTPRSQSEVHTTWFNASGGRS